MSHPLETQLKTHDLRVLLDCHSFATHPLPSEPDQSPEQPDICIGTDAFRTPQSLLDELEARFASRSLRAGIDAPFAGTLVPMRYFRNDPRVVSVMIEVRRGLYCDETTGELTDSFEQVVDQLHSTLGPAIQRLVFGLTRRAGGDAAT